MILLEIFDYLALYKTNKRDHQFLSQERKQHVSLFRTSTTAKHTNNLNIFITFIYHIVSLLTQKGTIMWDKSDRYHFIFCIMTAMMNEWVNHNLCITIKWQGIEISKTTCDMKSVVFQNWSFILFYHFLTLEAR